MSSTRESTSRPLFRAVLLGLVVASLASLPEAAVADAAQRIEGTPAPQHSQPLQAEDYDPEANLPYLFAVFIITWAGFFSYVFIMSRRRREMQREIDVLKAAGADSESDPAEE